jgi:hypothetical protein
LAKSTSAVEVLHYVVAQAGRTGAAPKVLGSTVAKGWRKGIAASTAAGGPWGEGKSGAGGGLRRSATAATTWLLLCVGFMVVFFFQPLTSHPPTIFLHSVSLSDIVGCACKAYTTHYKQAMMRMLEIVWGG